jgi:hypothetical protein
MKQFFVMFLACIAALGVFFGLLGMLLYKLWWTAPFNPSLMTALPADYTSYWGWVAAGFGLVALTVVGELGIIIAILKDTYVIEEKEGEKE